MSIDIFEELENKRFKRKKNKSVLVKQMRCLKRDLERGVLKPQECLERGLEELMDIIRVELGNSIQNKAFTLRYSGFDNMLTLMEYMFPDFDLSSYKRIYRKISEKLYGIKPDL